MGFHKRSSADGLGYIANASIETMNCIPGIADETEETDAGPSAETDAGPSVETDAGPSAEAENDSPSVSILLDRKPVIDNWQMYLQKSRVLFMHKFKKKMRNRGDDTLDLFQRRRVLGTGSFGTVVAVTHTRTQRSYAMKILPKKRIVAQKQVEHTYAEKRVLQSVQFPFLVNMEFYFVDKHFLYFIMPLALAGEMFQNIRRAKYFSEDLCRFYTAQVVLALEYLHFMDLAYRDLKPENLVVFDTGYIKLTDFGFCKIVTGRTYTMCGTPEYMAPEVLLNRGYGRSVDWWALGVLMYEMSFGFSPFMSGSLKRTYEKILSGKVRFPKSTPETMRHLTRHLIEPDVTRRYGNLRAGVDDIKTHAWFVGLNWLALVNQQVTPPSVPPAKSISSLGDPYDPAAYSHTSDYGRFTNIFKDF